MYLLMLLVLLIRPRGVSQECGLFSGMSVAENMELGRLRRRNNAGIYWDEERIFSFFPRIKQRWCSAADFLSGGEQQMVAVARALSGDTRVLLLDEPFEGLAPAVIEELFEAFDKPREELSILIIDHHLDLALALSDRTVALKRGAGDAYRTTAGAVGGSGAAREGVVAPTPGAATEVVRYPLWFSLRRLTRYCRGPSISAAQDWGTALGVPRARLAQVGLPRLPCPGCQGEVRIDGPGMGAGKCHAHGTSPASAPRLTPDVRPIPILPELE